MKFLFCMYVYTCMCVCVCRFLPYRIQIFWKFVVSVSNPVFVSVQLRYLGNFKGKSTWVIKFYIWVAPHMKDIHSIKKRKKSNQKISLNLSLSYSTRISFPTTMRDLSSTVQPLSRFKLCYTLQHIFTSSTSVTGYRLNATLLTKPNPIRARSVQSLEHLQSAPHTVLTNCISHLRTTHLITLEFTVIRYYFNSWSFCQTRFYRIITLCQLYYCLY